MFYCLVAITFAWVTLNLMDERNTSLLVDSLQSKVEKLIIQHKKAKEDIKQLKDENLFLQKKLSETKIQLTDVNEQNKVLKLAKF